MVKCKVEEDKAKTPGCGRKIGKEKAASEMALPFYYVIVTSDNQEES